MAQLISVKLSRYDNSPWGFRLQGGKDFGTPLIIQKVNGGSPAEKAGLQAGDAVLRINNVDATALRHKDAQDVIVRAGNSFELAVQRGGIAMSTWKPHVTPVGAGPVKGGGVSPVTKTSLAYKGPPSTPIGSGHNVAAKPFGTIAHMNGGPEKQIVNKQYNSPVGIYSEQAIAETLSAQAEVLSGGAIGVNFKKNEKDYNAANSEVFKMVQEADKEPRAPEPDPQVGSPVAGGVATPFGVHGLRHVQAPEPKAPSSPSQDPFKVLPPGQNICADCERLIVGVFVRIKDKNLHVECFKCATCGTPLKNVGYYNLNNKLYCDIHAKLVARQNPPAPNLEPVTVPPGARPPAGTISNALAGLGVTTSHPHPSAAPLSPSGGLSPQPGTVGPLPFHAPRVGTSHVSAPKPQTPSSVSGPRPFGSPVSAAPPSGPAMSNSFGRPASGGFSPGYSPVYAPSSGGFAPSSGFGPTAGFSSSLKPLSKLRDTAGGGQSADSSGDDADHRVVWPPLPDEDRPLATACPIYVPPKPSDPVLFPPPAPPNPPPVPPAECRSAFAPVLRAEHPDGAARPRTPAVSFQDDVQSHKKLSMCSREVCDLSARLQTLTAALATHMMVESLSRPASPVPDQKLAEPVVTALQNIVYGSARASTTSTPAPPADRLDLPDGLTPGKPRCVRGLSPEPRPPTPGQVVVFPPELPPELSRPASRMSRAHSPQPEWQSQFTSALCTAPGRPYSPFVTASQGPQGPQGPQGDTRRRQTPCPTKQACGKLVEIEDAGACGRRACSGDGDVQEATALSNQVSSGLREVQETMTQSKQVSSAHFASQVAEASNSRRTESTASLRPRDPGPSEPPQGTRPSPSPMLGPIMYRATASPIHMRTFDTELVTEQTVEETKMASEKMVIGDNETETTVIEKEITTTLSQPGGSQGGDAQASQPPNQWSQVGPQRCGEWNQNGQTCSCGQNQCGQGQCGQNQSCQNQCGQSQCSQNQCGQNQCGQNQCCQNQCGQSQCGQSQCCQQQGSYGQGSCGQRQCRNQSACNQQANQCSQRGQCCQQRSTCCHNQQHQPPPQPCCRHTAALLAPQPFGRRVTASPCPCRATPSLSEPPCRANPCQQQSGPSGPPCRATPCPQQPGAIEQSSRATPCPQQAVTTEQPCRATPCQQPRTEGPCRAAPCQTGVSEQPSRATPCQQTRQKSPSPLASRRVSEPVMARATPPPPTIRPTQPPAPPAPPADEPYMPRPPSQQPAALRPKRSVSPITAAQRCVSPFLADMAVSAIRAHSPVPGREDTPPPAARQSSRWPPPPPPPPMPQPLYNTRAPIMTEGQRRMQQHQKLQEKIQRDLSTKTPDPEPEVRQSAWTPPGRRHLPSPQQQLNPFQMKLQLSQQRIQSRQHQQQQQQPQVTTSTQSAQQSAPKSEPHAWQTTQQQTRQSHSQFQQEQSQYLFDWQREEEEAEELGVQRDTVIVCVSPTIVEQHGGHFPPVTGLTLASALATAPLRPYSPLSVPPATMRTEPVPLPPETAPWEPPPHPDTFGAHHVPRAVSPFEGARRCVSPFLRDMAVTAIRSHSPRPATPGREDDERRRRREDEDRRRRAEEERRRREEEERRRREEEDRRRREEQERRRREEDRRQREDEERKRRDEEQRRRREEEERRRMEEERQREEEERRRREQTERRAREESERKRQEEERRQREDEDRRRRDEEERRRREEDDRRRCEEERRRQEEERRRQEEERRQEEDRRQQEEQERNQREEEERRPLERISMKEALTIASDRPYSPFVILPPPVEFTPRCMAETTPCQPIPLQTSAPSAPAAPAARGPQFNPVDMPQLLRRPNEALGAFRPFPSTSVSSQQVTETVKSTQVSSVSMQEVKCSVSERAELRSPSPFRREFDVYVPSPSPKPTRIRSPLPLEEKKRHPFVETPLRSPISVPRYQQTGAAPPPPPRTPSSPSQSRRAPDVAPITHAGPRTALQQVAAQGAAPQPMFVRKTPPPSPRPSVRTTPTPGYPMSPLAGRATVFGHHGLRAAAPAFSHERQGPASEPQSRRTQSGIPKQVGHHLPHKPSPLCTPPPAFTLPDPEPQPEPQTKRAFQRVADSPSTVTTSASPALPRPAPSTPSCSRIPTSSPARPSSQAPARPPAPSPADLHPSCSLPDAGGPGGAKGGAFAGASAPTRGRGILNPAAVGTRIPLCGACNQQIRGPFITALGKIWCPHHFVCSNSKCQRPLQDIGFVEEKGHLYCEYCFEQFIAPPCDKCGHKIKGDCLNAIGKHFHPECFNCVYCGKLFGNSPFFLEDGQPYCENDWNELFTTKCFACGFPIEAGDRWVEALSNNYHSQCFNCSMCKKNLEGQSFFAKGGRPFCKNHAR